MRLWYAILWPTTNYCVLWNTMRSLAGALACFRLRPIDLN